MAAPEQLDTEVALAGVDEHAGDHLPAVEGRTVGPGGRLPAGRPSDVGEAAAGHGPPGGLLEGSVPSVGTLGRRPKVPAR